MSVVPCQVSGAYFSEAALFKMSIEQLPATTIHRHDMTEKLLKAALNSKHKHTHIFLFLSFRRLAINLPGSPLILFPTNHIML